jgi:hypothetical protein
MQDTLKYIAESPYAKEVQYSVYAISNLEDNNNIDSIESEVIDKGLFIGGISNPLLNEKIISVEGLVRAYYAESVVGNVFDLPPVRFKNKFIELYQEAITKL